MRHKYNAKRVTIDGIKFASQFEGKIYEDIKRLMATGTVESVKFQEPFKLHGRNGSFVCKHVVDFLITYFDGSQEVWEAKGYATDVWRLKKKLFEDNYPDIKYVVQTRNRQLAKEMGCGNRCRKDGTTWDSREGEK